MVRSAAWRAAPVVLPFYSYRHGSWSRCVVGPRQRAAAACRRELKLAPSTPSVATAVAAVPGEGLARPPDDGLSSSLRASAAFPVFPDPQLS